MTPAAPAASRDAIGSVVLARWMPEDSMVGGGLCLQLNIKLAGRMTQLLAESPRGKFALFTSRREAEAFQAAVNRALGLPRPGVFGGDGHHIPVRQAGWAFTHAELLSLPGANRWAHLVDDKVTKLLRRRRVPALRTPPAELPSEWASADVVTYATRAEGALLKSFLASAPRLPPIEGAARFVEDGSLLDEPQRHLLGKSRDAFLQLSPRQFETAVADTLLAQSCAVFLGPGSRDGGVDVVAASLRDITPSILLVQCKCQRRSPVGEAAVKGLLADVLRYNATSGLLATTHSFTAPARKLAAEYSWRLTLWAGDDVYTHFRAHVIEHHP